MKGNKQGRGQPPRVIRGMTDEEIQKRGNSLDTEDVGLKSLGLSDNQVSNVKLLKRWRLNWDIGKSLFDIEQNQRFKSSPDTAIQKMIAERTLPQLAETANAQIEWDCPPYWLKELDTTKLKKIRND